MKNRTCWLIFTLRSKFGSHCLIIWKYDTHASNSLGDIRQNHWTMKYRSDRPTFILRSNVGSYWPIIPKYDVHTTNTEFSETPNPAYFYANFSCCTPKKSFRRFFRTPVFSISTCIIIVDFSLCSDQRRRLGVKISYCQQIKKITEALRLSAWCLSENGRRWIFIRSSEHHLAAEAHRAKGRRETVPQVFNIRVLPQRLFVNPSIIIILFTSDSDL